MTSRILILGATGAVGIQLIRDCLNTFPTATVVIYARSPGKLPQDLSENSSLKIIEGSLEDKASLSEALQGVDVILSALGPSVQRGPFHPSGAPLAKAYEGLVDLMQAAGIRRIVLLGTTSISDSHDHSDWRYKAMVATVSVLARNAYKEFVAIGEVFRSKGSDLDYTVARVPVLTNSDSREYKTGYVGDSDMSVYLSRTAYSTFVMTEIQQAQWIRLMPLVTST